MKKCFIIFSLLLIFLSCTDDSLLSNQENYNSVEHAQKWFEQNVKISSSSNGRISSRLKNVSWENGISYVKDKTQTVEVPIQYETELIAYPQCINKNASYKNLTKLLMFDDDKGGYNIFVMRIMPDIASVPELEKNTYDRKANSFTGDIIYYTWEGNPIVYARYDNGKRVEWNYIEQSSKNGDTSGARITNECYTIEVKWYQIVCIDGNCSGPIYLDTDYYDYCPIGSIPNYDEDVYPGDLYGGGSSGGETWNNNTVESRQQALAQLLESNPFLLIELPCAELEKWKTIANKTLSQQAANRLDTLKNNQSWLSAIIPYNGWSVQTLQAAKGTVVNMDYFSVTISQLPPGKSANQLLSEIRKNVNNFIDPTKANFEPFSGPDKTLWGSNNPTGSIIHIDMGSNNTWTGAGFNPATQPEDGTVICSQYEESNWTFTTIQAPGDFQHPVSGNREFGYVTNPNNTYTFYTRGVDRLTGTIDQWYSDYKEFLKNNTIFEGKTPFNAADELWSSFQQGIKDSVIANGGSAQINPAVTSRPDWVKIESYLFGNTSLESIGCK